MILFRLSRNGVPPYLQLVQQVKQALQMGLLHEGDRLPTAKEVVKMVALNPNTVAKAYRELEAEGLVKGQAGLGTFVVKRPEGPDPAVQAKLAADLTEWVDHAKRVGLDSAAIELLMRAVIQQGGNNDTNK